MMLIVVHLHTFPLTASALTKGSLLVKKPLCLHSEHYEVSYHTTVNNGS